LQYVTQDVATKMDVDLMGPEVGFTTEQLMELAGLAMAQAVAKVWPTPSDRSLRVFIICGPGNKYQF
jgi:NAD(P)H-hydrate epimerase